MRAQIFWSVPGTYHEPDGKIYYAHMDEESIPTVYSLTALVGQVDLSCL